MSAGSHAAWMARAIRLAERGLLTTAPNPRVGCVLVRDGRVVGEGWHQRAGDPHAEVLALRDAGEQARGATAYVSLEPCNHQGRTGPCSEALIAAGVSAVAYAAADEGAGSGGGAQRLRDAGIVVEGGLLAAEAEALNPGFHRRQRGGRAWLRLKLAQSLDGRSVQASGQSQWITGEAARRDGHRWRARSCALLTGIGTVLADDPQLTPRLDGEACALPLRVVLDSRGRTPESARLRKDGNFLILHGSGAGPIDRGEVVAQVAGGLDLFHVLEVLGQRGCNELLVEAGPSLSGAFLRSGLVDELILYQAPSLIGDGLPGAALGALPTLAERLDFTVLESRRIGNDWRIIARPNSGT